MPLQLKGGTECLLQRSAICCFLSLVGPHQAKFEPATGCRLQVSLSCAVLSHIVSLQYLSRSSLHRLAGLHCCLFLSYGIQVVTREVHRSSLRQLICPAQDHYVFFTLLIIYMTGACPLPGPDVGLSIFACDVEHTSFHFGLCGRTFVLCLFVQCQVHHYVIAGSTQEVYTCLFKQMARLLLKISRSQYGYKLYFIIFLDVDKSFALPP